MKHELLYKVRIQQLEEQNKRLLSETKRLRAEIDHQKQKEFDIVRLLGDESYRFQVAEERYKSQKEIAEALGVTTRTFYRLKERFKNQSILNNNGK